MLFSTYTLALLSAPLLVFAQNSFNVPTGGYNATAGQSLSLTWTPTTSGTVSLLLRSGPANMLDAGSVIAQNISNSGSYTWSVPSNTPAGMNYAVEIIDDANPNVVNYTPPFTLISTVTASPSSASMSSTATGSSSSSSSSASMSGSSSASTSGSSTSSSSGSASSTGTSSRSSHSMAATSGAGIQMTSSGNAAPARATAMAGFLGAVALGALAL